MYFCLTFSVVRVQWWAPPRSSPTQWLDRKVRGPSGRVLWSSNYGVHSSWRTHRQQCARARWYSFRNSECVSSGAAYRPPLLARCDIRGPEGRRRSLSAAVGRVPHHPTPPLPTDDSQLHWQRRRRPPPKTTALPLTITPPPRGAAAHRRPRVCHRHRTRRQWPLAMRHLSGHPWLVFRALKQTSRGVAMTVNCTARALPLVDARATLSGSSIAPRLAPQRRCHRRLRRRVDPKETEVWSDNRAFSSEDTWWPETCRSHDGCSPERLIIHARMDVKTWSVSSS